MNRWGLDNEDEAFRAECRRRMAMPLEQRLFEGFVNRSETFLPERVNGSFATMAKYRRWCHAHLPPHLGFRMVDDVDDSVPFVRPPPRPESGDADDDR